jgi:hypothetical protein
MCTNYRNLSVIVNQIVLINEIRMINTKLLNSIKEKIVKFPFKRTFNP